MIARNKRSILACRREDELLQQKCDEPLLMKVILTTTGGRVKLATLPKVGIRILRKRFWIQDLSFSTPD